MNAMQPILPLSLQLFALYVSPGIGVALAYRRPTRTARTLLRGGALGGMIGGAIVAFYDWLVRALPWQGAIHLIGAILWGLLLALMAVALQFVVGRLRAPRRPAAL